MDILNLGSNPSSKQGNRDFLRWRSINAVFKNLGHRTGADLKNALIFLTKSSEVFKIMLIKSYQMLEAWKTEIMPLHGSLNYSAVLIHTCLRLGSDLLQKIVSFLLPCLATSSRRLCYCCCCRRHCHLFRLWCYRCFSRFCSHFCRQSQLQWHLSFVYLLANSMPITQVVLLHRWLHTCWSQYVFIFGKYFRYLRIIRDIQTKEKKMISFY